MASGDKCGAKLDRGGETTGSLSSSLATCGSRGGEDDERYSGGAEVALREGLRVDVEALGAAALRVRGFGGGRAGEDDSAPDWKTLLSSHPLSSANCEHREYTKITIV
jgi:hypothetical protein